MSKLHCEIFVAMEKTLAIAISFAIVCQNRALSAEFPAIAGLQSTNAAIAIAIA